MPDITTMHIDQLESAQQPGVPDGLFRYAGKSLGITAWGMNVLTLPPGWDQYPEHDHGDDGHEEVYVVLRGSATLHVGPERFELAQGSFTRVGPGERRKIVPGPEGVMFIAVGGTPGKPYVASWGRLSEVASR
jgi:mannose-6-phosphate isomerase-like protein (cupin superfamily)